MTELVKSMVATSSRLCLVVDDPSFSIFISHDPAVFFTIFLILLLCPHQEFTIRRHAVSSSLEMLVMRLTDEDGAKKSSTFMEKSLIVEPEAVDG